MTHLKWWQEVVFYQIYPRSFADGNGDGIGDFPGITGRLDYLRDLGIGAIWLSPHYPSPFLDCGYDISDYDEIAPEYGTMADFQTFIDEAHKRNIRVVLDLVLNHSSDQHAWFQASRSSRTDARRDWYVWRDGRDGGPPNNWVSIFGGSAWELDPLTGQYYYHAFLKEQPDLNWRNPEVKAAMWAMVRRWLDMGVDGFRLDAISTIFENPDLPDHDLPFDPEVQVDPNRLSREEYHQLMRHQTSQPGLHDLMRELRALVDTYPGDRVLIGEDEDLAYHGPDNDELHLVFNFPLMRADRLTPDHIRANQAERLAALPAGAWPCNTLGNHDTDRAWTRYGDGENDAALARLHLALLLTLKGTPVLYNGEEIGMSDLILSDLSQLRDSAVLNKYHILVNAAGWTPAAALQMAIDHTRDRCRSPLQWQNAANAGFCPPGVTPWLPVNDNFAAGVNVADQEADPDSLLHFYRQLIRLRQATPALLYGEYQALHTISHNYLAYLRYVPQGGQRCLVLLNFTDTAQAVRFDTGAAVCLYSSSGRPAGPLDLDRLALAPFAVLIAELS